MVNYEEKSNKEINRAVAMYFMPPAEDDVSLRYFWCDIDSYDYCNDWSIAGPIILENKISIYLEDEVFAYKGERLNHEGCVDGYDFICDNIIAHNKNPLRAAMIVFLMMKDAENEAT